MGGSRILSQEKMEKRVATSAALVKMVTDMGGASRAILSSLASQLYLCTLQKQISVKAMA
jgi:hypothetical protein